jgi:hypothetical protein
MEEEEAEIQKEDEIAGRVGCADFMTSSSGKGRQGGKDHGNCTVELI